MQEPSKPTGERIVEPRNARNDEYRGHLERILTSGVCPFCPGGDTYETQERTAENEYWIASRNYQPLPNTRHHFIFVPKRHVTERIELNAAELRSLIELEAQMKKENNIPGAVLYGRDGDMLTTGATVAHLHFQMIEPDGVAQVYFGHVRKP